MRSESYRDDETALTPNSKPLMVTALNSEYRFEVESTPGGLFAIGAYTERNPEESRDTRWSRALSSFYGTVATDFNGNSLLDLLETGAARITSARRATYEDRACVEFETVREFTNSGVQYSVVGKVIVYPAQHWAIVYYEEAFMNPRAGRKSRITYNPNIAEVAFPRRVVLEDHDEQGHVFVQSDVTFEEPRPSQAKAEDFTLESFALERPRNASRPLSGGTTNALLMNGVIAALLALGALVIYVRSKRTVMHGKR